MNNFCEMKGHLTCKGESLTDSDEEKFFSFTNSLKGSSIIYRGLSKDYLKQIYHAGVEDLPVLSERLFLYGSKGKIFCENFKSEYDINNIDDICFKSILNTLKETFTNESKNSNSVNRHMPFFKKDNDAAIKELVSYSEETWVKKIGGLSEEGKENVKDYYISFLHTIEKAGYGKYSYFLSTTRKRQQAERFRRNEETGIIVVGWTNDKRIKCVDCHDLKEIVSNYGFPTFDKPVYPEQKEITYKCGLLPHFIIGFYYKDKFEINPYIVKIDNLSDVCKNGLPIDQKDFIEKISNTGFKSYFNVCDCFYWQQNV